MIPGFFLLVIVAVAESSRILAFFPIPTPSHQFIFRPVVEGLAKNGHDVVFFTGYPYKEVPKNITQIDLSKYDPINEFKDIDFGSLNIWQYTDTMYKLGVAAVRNYIGSKEVQDLIHSDQKFDAVMFESYFYQEYLSALIHKFNAIGIELISLGDCAWVNEMSGLIDNPSYQIDFKSALSSDMTFWQKLYNFFVTGVTTLTSYYYMHHALQPVMDEYFNYTGWESRPPIDVLARNRSLILVNFDYLFGYPYPVAPHRKDIGGINIRPNQPLPKDLQTFMEESKNGVIYMSLGSHLDPSKFRDQMKIFLDVFRDLPQRVMLKYVQEDSIDTPDNVKVSKWFPQQDILAHENCVLFITHGGLLSLSEAIYYAVPQIGIPIMADQRKNMVIMESHGLGRMLKLDNITHETVSWTIHEVLSNIKRYKTEAHRRSKMLKDKRHTPAEEAVYWVEHTLKYPFALTPKSTTLSAIQFHLIDVQLFIASTLLFVIYCIYLILKLLKVAVSKTKRKQKVH